MTILIIDDEPGLRQTVSLILTEEGYQVHTAASGAEALGMMASRPVNLAILDLKMEHIMVSGPVKIQPRRILLK